MGLQLTQLSRFIEQLEEAGLVSVDLATDSVELTPMGHSLAKLQHVMTSQP